MNWLFRFQHISRLLFIALWFILPQNIISQTEEIAKISVENKLLKVKQGEQVTVELTLSVQSGWHINSNKPNDDFLIPSVISAKADGIKLINIKYPQAQELKLSFSEEPVSVYEGIATAKLTLQAGKDIKVGKQNIIVILEYQACNDV